MFERNFLFCKKISLIAKLVLYITLIILEIQKTGLGGGASDDPNDVTYVADDALSGFGGDYDYSDYYDDYETTEIEAKDISGDQSKIRQEEITIPERKVTLTLFHIYYTVDNKAKKNIIEFNLLM